MFNMFTGRKRTPAELALRLGQQRREPPGLHLPEIDRNLGKRQQRSGRIEGAPYDDRVSKVRAVLDPIQMNMQPRQGALIDLSVLEESRERFNDASTEFGERLARTLDAAAGGLEALVEVDKHRVVPQYQAGGALLQKRSHFFGAIQFAEKVRRPLFRMAPPKKRGRRLFPPEDRDVFAESGSRYVTAPKLDPEQSWWIDAVTRVDRY